MTNINDEEVPLANVPGTEDEEGEITGESEAEGGEEEAEPETGKSKGRIAVIIGGIAAAAAVAIGGISYSLRKKKETMSKWDDNDNE